MAEAGIPIEITGSMPPHPRTKGLRQVISRAKELKTERREKRPYEDDKTARLHSISTALLELKDKKIEAAEQEAAHDALTGLRTKSLFDTTLNQEIAAVERDRRSFPLELTLMDIDNFGAFNKQYGIPTGDEVLKMVGTTINGTLRASDMAFRIGGEELALISRKTHNPEKSGDKLISERHREAIANTQSENGHSVTVSVGQTDFIRGEDRKTFIDRANTALIVAKRLGKDRAVIGEVIEGREVYTDTLTKKTYSVLKDTDGKLLEIIEIKPNG